MQNPTSSKRKRLVLCVAILSISLFILWETIASAAAGLFIPEAREVTRYLFVKGIFVAVFLALLVLTGTLKVAGFHGPVRPLSILWGAPFLLIGAMTLIPALQGGLNLPIEVILGWFAVITIGVIGEDGVFRGILYGALSDIGHWLRAAITSLAFGSIHLLGLNHGFDPSIILAQFCFASAGGLVFYAVRVSGGSIWSVLILHFLFDAAVILPAAGISSMLSDPAEMVPRMLGAAAFMLVWGVVSLFFVTRKKGQAAAVAA
jgi:membrane protease YdiL (CAAX protease family)